MQSMNERIRLWMGVCVLQAVNEMFKKSLSVLMDEFKPLANSVATMMIEMYETTPHASILDVARQVKQILWTTGSVKVFYTWDNWISKSILHLGQLNQ